MIAKVRLLEIYLPDSEKLTLIFHLIAAHTMSRYTNLNLSISFLCIKTAETAKMIGRPKAKADT